MNESDKLVISIYCGYYDLGEEPDDCDGEFEHTTTIRAWQDGSIQGFQCPYCHSVHNMWEDYDKGYAWLDYDLNPDIDRSWPLFKPGDERYRTKGVNDYR